MAGTPVVGPNNVGDTTNLQPPVQVAGVDGNGAVRRVKTNTDGSFQVELTDGAGNPITLAADPSKADEAAFTVGTSLVTPIGIVYKDAATALSDGQIGMVRATNDRRMYVTDPANTGGSLTTYHLASAGSTNAAVVKNAAGALYGWYITNTNASIRYLCFHNTTSTPTAGASVFMKIGIPASGAANVSFKHGITFSSGIAITTVTLPADSDNTAVAANDLIINLFYA